MTRVELVRHMLRDGPVLARDLAIEAMCPIQNASQTLQDMEARGELTSRPFHDHAAKLGCRSAKLYERSSCHG